MSPAEPAAIVAVLVFWCGLVLFAIASIVWAIVAGARRKVAAITATCLWCGVAGFALSSAIWSWMTTTNLEYQYRAIERMPEGALAKDVRLPSMGMQTFFVHLDRLGRKFSYLTILIPLVGALVLLRRAHAEEPRAKFGSEVTRDDLFSPHG